MFPLFLIELPNAGLSISMYSKELIYLGVVMLINVFLFGLPMNIFVLINQTKFL